MQVRSLLHKNIIPKTSFRWSLFRDLFFKIKQSSRAFHCYPGQKKNYSPLYNFDTITNNSACRDTSKNQHIYYDSTISKMNKITTYLARNLKNLFLIDSLGALLTTLFLIVLLQIPEHYMGMPKNVLTYLSILSVCFCIYSASYYLFLKNNKTAFIKIIGVANILYSVLIIGLLIINYNSLTKFGTTYFLIEAIIICSISYVELSTAKKLSN